MHTSEDVISFFHFVVGIIGIIWSVVWLALVSNSPANQRWISAKELHYIESSLADDKHEKVLATFSLLSVSLEREGRSVFQRWELTS